MRLNLDSSNTLQGRLVAQSRSTRPALGRIVDRVLMKDGVSARTSSKKTRNFRLKACRHLAVTAFPYWLGSLLIVTGCSMPAASVETTMQPGLMEEGARVETLVDSMSDLSAAESDDLAMAWTDLNDDLISVSRDLQRDPTSVDLEGVVSRVESFYDRFGSHETMQSLEAEWARLIETVTTVSERVASR
jgi:hypothetical protein